MTKTENFAAMFACMLKLCENDNNTDKHINNNNRNNNNNGYLIIIMK